MHIFKKTIRTYIIIRRRTKQKKMQTKIEINDNDYDC